MTRAVAHPFAQERRALARPEMQVLLIALDDSQEPMGSRRATELLREAGFSVSESTVSRLLRDLDANGWTRPVGAKGRTLTADGRTAVADVRRSLNGSGDALSRALDVRTLGDMLELFVARRGVEREAAGGAAANATAEEVAHLRTLVEEQAQGVEAGTWLSRQSIAIHRAIGGASGNRLLATICDILYATELDPLEAAMDIVVGLHHSERLALDDHVAIVDAIAARDPAAAERAMSQHIDRLIVEIKQYTATGSGPVFERMLEWIRKQDRPGGPPDHADGGVGK